MAAKRSYGSGRVYVCTDAAGPRILLWLVVGQRQAGVESIDTHLYGPSACPAASA